MNTSHSPEAIRPTAAKRRALAGILLAGGFALAGLGPAIAAAHAALSPSPTVDRNFCYNNDVDRSSLAVCRSSDPPMA